MGIDQLGFQSVQLGPSAITARWFSNTTDQLVTTPMIALYLSSTTHLSVGHNVALSQILNRSKAQYISPGHGNLSLLKRATSLVTPNTAGTSLELNSKSSRTLGSSFVKTFDQHCYFVFLSSVDSGHLTGIIRKSYSRRAQRHQSCPKQRRKSTAIYRRRVRMNSNYRGFTGENDEKYRISAYTKAKALSKLTPAFAHC
ncbi:myosin-6-like [Dorcoceras hygrometricum]|uniref:Myosin-6-like n=1 Tax=Dorcoceras hygrometricum TaxID=472368 RepID=A0A2Z7A643_9LAMI|nr:myosin-6-like [Dorcoceras hygrometricum]